MANLYYNVNIVSTINPISVRTIHSSYKLSVGDNTDNSSDHSDEFEGTRAEREMNQICDLTENSLNNNETLTREQLDRLHVIQNRSTNEDILERSARLLESANEDPDMYDSEPSCQPDSAISPPSNFNETKSYPTTDLIMNADEQKIKDEKDMHNNTIIGLLYNKATDLKPIVKKEFDACSSKEEREELCSTAIDAIKQDSAQHRKVLQELTGEMVDNLGKSRSFSDSEKELKAMAQSYLLERSYIEDGELLVKRIEAVREAKEESNKEADLKKDGQSPIDYVVSLQETEMPSYSDPEDA